MAYFPMMVELQDAKVLIIGGGVTALRKAEQMLSFGAACHVIAPTLDEGFAALPCSIEKRRYRDGDITAQQGLAMVIAATDDRAVNRAVSECCQALHIPVNVVDDLELCSFIFPSIVREQEVVCGISSGGRSPLVTQHIKKLLQEIWPTGIGEINEEMGRCRLALQQSEPDITKRRARLKERLQALLAKRPESL